MATRSPKETVAEKETVKWAEKNGWLAWKLKIIGKRGIHDRLFISLTGVHVYIEFKRRGKKAEGLQLYWQRVLSIRNVACYTDVTEAIYAINILREAGR